jgi:hypothetical protein
MRKNFLLSTLFMLTISVSMSAQTITHIGDIGSTTIKNGSIADLVVTTTAAVQSGDDIIIAYASDPSQDLNIAISDGAGNTYQQAAMAINVGNLRTYIFAAYNVNALSSGSTITITQTVYSSTAVAARAAVVSVFRGLAPSGALEQSCVSSGSSTSPSSGAATTIQADQLLIGAVGTEGPGTDNAGTWSNSFTEGPRAGTTATTTDAEITVSMGYRIVSSAGSYTAAKTGITSRDWAAAIATFKTTDFPISYIGNIGGNWSKTAGTSLVVTTTAAVTAGDDIVLVFAADEEGTVSSVTDAAGNTYELAVQAINDQTGTAAGVRTHIYAAYNANALSSGSSITITHTSVTSRSAVVSVFRGLATSSALDRTHTATGTTNTVSSGATSTTTQADELLIGAVGLEGPNVDAPSVWQNSFSYGPRLGTSFGASSGDATDITAQMGWRIVGATGAYTAQIVNLNTTRDWAAAIATFKAAVPLPIQMASFAADVVRDNQIEVAWRTVSETNNYGFEIYRKRGDAGEWVKISFVQGHGTTLAPQSYTYVDAGLSFGKYCYRIKQVDLDGKSETFPEMSVSVGVTPDKMVLAQNYPNPFNPSTLIEFVVPQTGFATMKVYNVLGQEVASLFAGNVEAGKISTARFNASDLPSGLYLYTLRAAGRTETKRMLLTK